MRPAVDVSMESAAAHHGSAVIGVVLTGMGADGTEGARCIKAAGGKVIAEHESTSVVYGMPRSVTEAGLADRVVPLPKVAATLTELIK
jgi:two-component system chemotaxis response regulator CheB